MQRYDNKAEIILSWTLTAVALLSIVIGFTFGY